MVDGSYEKGSKCFFPSGDVEDDPILPRVDARVFTSGQSAVQQQNARKFLEEVGVREVGEAEEIESLLKQRYSNDNFDPREADLGRFIALVEKDSSKAELFAEYFIFKCDDDLWRNPRGVFLDGPFRDTGLSVYYAALGKDARHALAQSYKDARIDVKRLVRFAQAVGVQLGLEFSKVSCWSNPQREYLFSVSGGRSSSPIDTDYIITGLEELLAKPSVEISKLVWRTMSSLPEYPDYLRATYQRNRSWGPRQADSQVVYHLNKAQWVPQTNGSFVQPADASRELLPEGFPFDPGWRWLKAVHFGEEITKRSEEQHRRQAAAQELGFVDQETLDRAKRFASLSPEEQERILAEYERLQSSELPERAPANPERRAERVSAQAAAAPDRRTEQRIRSVSVGREEVKQETAQYLRAQYTNADGEMICQVCKGPLPFKLDDGSYYFEKVEFLPELKKRHYQNYLALCPNHAAMFQHAHGSTELMHESFVDLASNELDVVLAKKDTTIYFTKTHITDLRAVIEADIGDNVDNPPEPDQLSPRRMPKTLPAAQ